MAARTGLTFLSRDPLVICRIPNFLGRIVAYFVLFANLLFAFGSPSSLRADERGNAAAVKDLRSWIEQHAPADLSFALHDLHSGREMIAINAAQALKPASVLKVLTSFAALAELGPDYRFETEILSFGKRDANGRLAGLVMRGGGDPELTLESLWLLARRIRKEGVRKIETLYLDGSRFLSEHQRQGERAFQAGASALSFNFNSVEFRVCPANAVGGGAGVTVDPIESGIKLNGVICTVAGSGGTFSIDEIGADDGPYDGALAYRLSGTIGRGRGCETFYRSVRDPKRLLANTLRAFLGSQGIEVAHIVLADTPAGAKRLFTHDSKALSLIVEDLNHFSTNFIAEHLMYVLGPVGDGRFDRERGLAHVGAVLRHYEVPTAGLVMMDGSGLSHENRVSANTVVETLIRGAQQPAFGIEFLKSLSVAGRNGTLKTRVFDSEGMMVLRGKTGTIDGVSSLAGLVSGASGRSAAFAILQNQVSSKERAAKFEEQLVSKIGVLLR